MCGCRDEGLLELNGKTYMLSLKVYETVKTDVAYVQDKTVSQIQAKDRILEYLKHKPWITNQKAQELCGYTKDQAYRILRKLVEEGKIEVKGAGRGRRYCLKENQRYKRAPRDYYAQRNARFSWERTENDYNSIKTEIVNRALKRAPRD